MAGIKRKIDELTLKDVATICDHTFLDRSEGFKARAKAGENPIAFRRRAFYDFLDQTLALNHKPYAVCVRPEDVSHARGYLDEKGAQGIVVASVVGFPDATWYSTKHKVMESEIALKDGAREIDYVVNYDWVRQANIVFLENEAKNMVSTAGRYGAKTKMILEVSELEQQDIILACTIAQANGVDFVKTSTGFSASGATIEALETMRKNFTRGIKISGGVKTLDDAKRFLRAAYGVIEGTGAEVDLDPMRIRIGESGLLKKVEGNY